MIGIQLGSVVLLTTAVAVIGTRVKKTHYWKGDHLFEVAADVGYLGVIGAIISWFASFHGPDTLNAALSVALFTTFFWPLFGLKWFGEWPGTSWADRNRANPAPGFIGFGTSMSLLGLGAYFACLNSGAAASALYVGLGIAGFAFCALFIMAALSEGFMTRG